MTNDEWISRSLIEKLPVCVTSLPFVIREFVIILRFLFAHLGSSVFICGVQMLTTLRIKNLALVADLTLELQPGCNVITGETGAGKSILIGALNLVLGERADRTLIRSGSDSCSVEAVFDISIFRVKNRPPRPATKERGEGRLISASS